MSTYGDRNTNNVFKPGGDLGDKEYYTRIDATTGEITVRRKAPFGDTTVATKLPGKKLGYKNRCDYHRRKTVVEYHKKSNSTI